jgi:hypothetical protein
MCAFGKAVVRTDKTDWASDVDLLSTRLENISEELDTLGPFPPGLREATKKQIDAKGQLITQRSQTTEPRPLLPPAILKANDSAADRFFEAWGSVSFKAGLDDMVPPGK